jgi:hypothetical protein
VRRARLQGFAGRGRAGKEAGERKAQRGGGGSFRGPCLMTRVVGCFQIRKAAVARAWEGSKPHPPVSGARLSTPQAVPSLLPAFSDPLAHLHPSPFLSLSLSPLVNDDRYDDDDDDSNNDNSDAGAHHPLPPRRRPSRSPVVAPRHTSLDDPFPHRATASLIHLPCPLAERARVANGRS